jgi:hypothetical protein
VAKDINGRIAAEVSWARTHNRAERTRPARETFLKRFERKVDPDGTPGYSWTLFINGQTDRRERHDAPGFETAISCANCQDTTETLEGKPQLTGTYNVTLTALDMTPVNPPHTASASFTIVVIPNPDVKTLQP